MTPTPEQIAAAIAACEARVAFNDAVKRRTELERILEGPAVSDETWRDAVRELRGIGATISAAYTVMAETERAYEKARVPA